MKENSIEETKKQLELILKVRKEQKEIIECAGGSCMNCDPDIKALSKSIEILSDYKRVLKENERYKKSDYETICLENNELREITDRIQSEYNDLMKDNFKLKNNIRKNENELEFDVNCDWITLQKILDESEKNNEYILYKNEKWIKEKYCIPVQKVKDKIEELQNGPLKINENNKYYYETEAYNKIIIQVLQELLEGRK